MAYQKYTLTQLQTLLAQRYESVPFWTSEEARLGLNEGLRIWNAITGFWKQEISAEATANDPYVPLAGSMVWQTRISFNGAPLVGPMSVREMDLMYSQWRSQTTASGGDVPTTPQYWIKISMTQFAFWPASPVTVPAAFTVNGVRSTPILTLPGDFIDLGEELFNVLLGYALHYVSFKLGGSIFASTREGYLAFLRAAAVQNDQFAASSFYRSVMGLDNQRFLVPPRRVQPIRTPAIEEQA